MYYVIYVYKIYYMYYMVYIYIKDVYMYIYIARLYNFVLVDFTFSVGLWAFRCLVCVVHELLWCFWFLSC